MTYVPIVEAAMKTRLVVAAIDFGTTYSGYAFSLRSDFQSDPLNILTNQWTAGSNGSVSLKTPTCILFDPSKQFDSFGFDAEDKYADLIMEDSHYDWFYFRRFKMLLYKNKKLTREANLKDDKGLALPALLVFSESIRYLKNHLLQMGRDKGYGLLDEEIHWVLTVPAIWDDAAKQFMREAAVQAGIQSDALSLALEPEAASLFCRHVPLTKGVTESKMVVESFKPGVKYLVLDAGGGTIDITVHETQDDNTVREIYAANGGPWGGTTVDNAFEDLLVNIVGKDTLEPFIRLHKDDYLDMFREFEVKKMNIRPDVEHKFVFRIPFTLQEVFKSVNGEDFRKTLMLKQELQGDVTFTGDKMRVNPRQVKDLFKEPCDAIIHHLQEIFNKPCVKGTDTIIMVGGFSESAILQDFIRTAFQNKRVVIPPEAGLSVLKGAVIFGHDPNSIASRVCKYTYGMGIYRRFILGTHPEERKVILDGIAKCSGCFDKHVEIGESVQLGHTSPPHTYDPASKESRAMAVNVYTTMAKDPHFVDDAGCEKLGSLTLDMSDIAVDENRSAIIQFVYGGTELGVEATIVKTGELKTAVFNFLG